MVFTAHLSDESKALSAEHHQNILFNTVRNLLNSVPGKLFNEEKDTWGALKWKFNWNLMGVLQPNMILEGRTKLHYSLGRPDMDWIFNDENLISNKEQTYV